MESLRKCFSALFPQKRPAGQHKAGTMPALIAQYHEAQSEEDKSALLEQIYARFPRTLFLASVCFPGDDPSKPVTDRTLHCSRAARNLYDANQGVIMQGNPGYNPGKRDSEKDMHLRTLVSKSSGQSWIPVFTDFTRYTACFGKKTRVALFTLREIRAMCQPGQGILIDPGEHALPLPAAELHKIR